MNDQITRTLRELRESRFVSEIEKLNFLEGRLLRDRTALNNQLQDIRARRTQLQQKFLELDSE